VADVSTSSGLAARENHTSQFDPIYSAGYFSVFFARSGWLFRFFFGEFVD
jgi:hypothetical protein